MKTCRFKNRIMDYLYSELSGDKLDDFKNHIENCSLCSDYLNHCLYTKQLLSNRSRPQPQKELLDYYHLSLKKIYQGANLIVRLINKISQNIFIRPPVVVRLAEITIILFLGIFIGKSLN